jgi:hypothetical protein
VKGEFILTPAKFYFFLIISFLVYNTSWATNYYVDKNATGGNTGVSWGDAWTSFAAIQWGSVNPGDIIYISGGTDSTVYNLSHTSSAHGILDLQSSGINGTADNLITIRNGLDAGHNGKVVIDGEGARSPIYIRYVNYIRFVGFTLQRPSPAIDAQVFIAYPSQVIYIDSMITRENLDGRGMGLYGIQSGFDAGDGQLDSVFIRWCHIDNNGVTTSQTDCIQAQFMHNLFVIGNTVINRNAEQFGHSEPAYFQKIENYWIEGNKFIATNTTTPQQVFHTYNLWGDLVVFNNLFWSKYQSGGTNNPPTNSGWTANVLISEIGQTQGMDDSRDTPATFFNNTVIGSRSFKTVDFQMDTIYAKNNIFYLHLPGYTESHGFVLSRPNNIPLEYVDYNLYQRNGDASEYIWGLGSSLIDYTMAQFNAIGGETSGTPLNRNLLNPLFVDSDDWDGDGCAVGVGSPCIDAGDDLGTDTFTNFGDRIARYNLDINGVTRPAGQYTIGAYQYANRGPDITPPDVTGATLLDSVTLRITFSEPLDPSTAQNPNNYSINNGINVVSALLTGSIVTLTSSPHSNGTYTVTVSNVEDIAGNIVSPTANSADYDWTVIQDVIPPEVTGATLLDSVKLVVNFSEALDATTAEDENNYSISNNIDIINASLSGSEVTLQTTAHSPGSYIVTVVNIKDLAGNVISQSANSAEYIFIPPDSLIMFTVEDVQGVIQEPEHTPLKTIDGLGALNGDPDSRWAAEPMPEELIFDLGSNRTVCKTKLSFYRWNYGRVYTYSILISSDNNNWVTIVSQATSAPQEEWTIDEFPSVDARYVKVYFINNNESDWAGLWEGEIWGIIPSVADSVGVNLKAILEGPYNEDVMHNHLRTQNLIPLAQPYYNTPWNYPGDESVSEIPEEVVDWVLLEIRSGIEVSSIVARRTAFLVSDGTIKDLNGESTVEFPEVSSGNYYVVVHHRNHLSIMTKDPIYLSESFELYDFTTSLDKAYGNQPMKQLAGGKFGLYAADGNANGNINRADNKNIWRKQNGSVGYKNGDYDMNGGVNIRDKNAVYKPNKGKNTGVPMN